MDGSAPTAGLIEEIEDDLDPRVQIELEKLNIATNEINILEATLEEANNSFRSSLNETSNQLQSLAKRLGNCIEKARPYYETAERAKKLQLDCQRAAIQFQRANVVHQAARETIALAEERFTNLQEKGADERKFDSAWQEMLNHATMKIMEAEAQKIASEREHLQIAATYASAQKEMQDLMRIFKTAINKSCPYFHHRTATQIHLEAQKDKIHKLQKEISLTKLRYSLSLQNLEQISEEIHELRRSNMKREPGVGAEMNHSPNFFENPANDCSDIDTKLHEEHQYWKDLRMKLNELQAEDNLALREDSLCFVENVTGSTSNTFSALPHSDTFSLSYEQHVNCKAPVSKQIIAHAKISEKNINLYSLVKDINGVKKIVEVDVPVDSHELNLWSIDKNEKLSSNALHDEEDNCIVGKCNIDVSVQPLCIADLTIDQELVPIDEDKESKFKCNEQQNEEIVENILENIATENEICISYSECLPTKEMESSSYVT